MKKTIFIVTCIVLAGVFSYFVGYFYYTDWSSEEIRLDSSSMQRTVQLLEHSADMIEYQYLVRIEQEVLVIYKIPENTIYDSVKVSGLQLMDGEYTALLNGIYFKNLAEVFEFLENSMS